MDKYNKIENELNGMKSIIGNSSSDYKNIEDLFDSGDQIKDNDGNLIKERFNSIFFPGKTYFIDYKTK